MQRFILSLVLSLCFTSSIVFAQKRVSAGPTFDIVDFNKKMEVAEWLCMYDAVAWWTSDSVMAQDKEKLGRLGNEWFCFLDSNNLWHAVYGKYENGYFDQVLYFQVLGRSDIRLIDDKLDTAHVNSYSRALMTANLMLKDLKDSINFRFNQYIRKNENGTFSVWLLPAFQPNGLAVYGGEFIYTVDATGNNILKDDSYYSGDFYGHDAGAQKEIWLNYERIEKPTLGAIFFVWYYKSYFPKIMLNTSKSISTVVKTGDDGWSWIHAEKELKKKKRSKE